MNNISPYQIATFLTEDPNEFVDLICEEYERSTNPATQRFWSGIRQSQHPFSAHPLMAMYGDESARKAYEHNLEAVLRAYPQLQKLDPQKLIRMLPQLQGRAKQQMERIIEAERPHRKQLEQLCVQLVSEVWGVPEELLDVELVDPQEMQQFANESGGEEQQEIPEMDVEEGPIDREQVNKRITMNALTQGAAVHNMGSIHKASEAAEGVLNRINPQLLRAYTQFSSSSTYAYWLIDFGNMARDMLQNFTIGTAKVDWGNDADNVEEYESEEGPEQEFGGYEPEFDEYEPEVEEAQQGPRIVARSIVFPVLVQETIKGVMELLSAHGLEGLSKQQLASIYQEADALEDEPWLIQVGPHLWRSFLKIVPRGHSLVDVVSTLARQSPQYIHGLLAETLESLHAGEDPAGPREALTELMAQLEEDDVADFDAGDYDEIGDEYGGPDMDEDDEDWGNLGDAW